MKNKINIAELLKDCPQGMEFDCTMYDNVKLDYVLEGNLYPIKIQTPEGQISLNKYGCYSNNKHAKCVIFPKARTTWEGFIRPFKDGDVLVHTQNERFVMSIYKSNEIGIIINTHAVFGDREEGLSVGMQICCYTDSTRFATEEEKQKLFDAIKAEGYHWNSETKTLEKLVEPSFKVGDRIRHITNTRQKNVVTEIKDTHYILDYESALPFTFQDEYDLVPNKFDITTLVPFESRVLVRISMDDIWRPAVFGFRNGYNDNAFCVVGGSCWKQCIPYLNNEHLCGTTNDCDEYYKTW